MGVVVVVEVNFVISCSCYLCSSYGFVVWWSTSVEKNVVKSSEQERRTTSYEKLLNTGPDTFSSVYGKALKVSTFRLSTALKER